MFGLTALSHRRSSQRSLGISETILSEPGVEARSFGRRLLADINSSSPPPEKPRELDSAFPCTLRSIRFELPRTSFPPRSVGRGAPFATEQRCSVHCARP